METGSLQNAIVGAFFMLTGILMMVFRRDLVAFEERWREAMPEALTVLQPRGRFLTVLIIAFGALSFLGGLTVFIVNLD